MYKKNVAHRSFFIMKSDASVLRTIISHLFMKASFTLGWTEDHSSTSIDLDVYASVSFLISNNLLTTSRVPPTRRQPLEAKAESTGCLSGIQYHIQTLAIVTVGLRNKNIWELDIGKNWALQGHGVGTVERRIGQVLMAHQPCHQRHNLCRSRQALVSERAGFRSLDGEEFGVQLLQSVFSNLLITELSSTACDESAQRTDTALVITWIHFVCATEVFDVQFAGFRVTNVLIADDGPDARADVREIGGQIHGVDAIGESAREAGDGKTGELRANGKDAAVRFGHLVFEGALKAWFDLFGIVVTKEAGGDNETGHANETDDQIISRSLSGCRVRGMTYLHREYVQLGSQG